MPTKPQLVLDDPWLEPQTEAIQRRMARFEAESVKKLIENIRQDVQADNFESLNLLVE